MNNLKVLEEKAPLFHYALNGVLWLWKQPFHGLGIVTGFVSLVMAIRGLLW